MRTMFLLIVIAVTTAALSACDEGPTSPETLLAAGEGSAQGQGIGSQVARVVGDITVGHTWPTIVWSRWQIDSWLDPAGEAGGTARVMFGYSPDCTWCPASNVWYQQTPVCISVDRTTRQAWIGFHMWVEDWQADHWFIVQIQDLAPATMPAVAHENSGRTDRVTFRSQMSTEAPAFCLSQPDLSTIEVSEYGLPAVELLPVEAGDVQIHSGALR